MTPAFKVLVVEDDPNTQKIIEKVLTRDIALRYLSLEVSVAGDGLEGLRLFHERRPDLVITDLLMPKLDGFKLLEAIRSSAHGKSTPVIVLTAVFRDRTTQQRLERDYGAVLQNKPFSPKQLAKQVQAMLRVPRAGGEAAAAPPAPARAPAPAPAAAAAAPHAAAAPAPPRPAPAPRPAAPAQPAAPAPARAAEPPRPLRQGTLQDTPVARLLLEAHDGRFSGLLDLRRGKARKVLYLLEGEPLYVQSNLRGETLGQMLIRRGGITAEQHARALALSEQQGVKYGEALVRLGLLTEAQVMEELCAQTRLKIESCLTWRSGSFALSEDASVGQKVPRCNLLGVPLVFEGLRRHPDLDEAFPRLAQKGSLCLTARPGLERHRETFIAVNGRRLLDALAPGRTVAEVIQATGSPHEAVLQIDALLQCGLVELTTPARPVSHTPPLSRPAVERSLSLEHLAELAPEPALPSPPAPSRESREEDSAVIWIAPVPGRQLRPAPKVDPERARVALQLVQATYLGLHDANHYQILGLSQQSEATQIEVAYKIKRRQFDVSAFKDVDLGEQRGRLDEICAALDEAYAVLADPARRAEYDQTLVSRSPQRARNNALRAEDLCREGETLFEKRQFAEAEVAFNKAALLDDQVQYHALHALAHFMANGESPQAAEESMVEVQTAIAADPGDSAGYLVAAKIGRSLGHLEEAALHLQKLIKLDPSAQEGFDELEDLLLEQGKHEALEVEYRRTLHLVGDQDPAWSALLWHRLALHYRDQLHQQEAARLACAAALRLKPKDRDLQALLAELDGVHPERWPEAVLGYRSLLRSDPDQAEPLHQLFRLHLTARRLDAAYLAASAAELRGAASPEEKELLAERRPEAPWAVEQPLAAAAWERLRHPDDDPGLASLLELLSPTIERRHRLGLSDFGVESGELIARQTLPGPFAEVLVRTATRLGLPAPSVALRPHLGADVQLLAVDPPVLLIGDGAMASEDLAELTFRLGRAVSLLRPGRRLAAGRPRRLLRAYVLAALSVAIPQAKVPDPDGEVAKAAAELKLLPDLDEAVRSAVIGLRQRFERLNLSDWQRAIQRSADRAGLLLCGDLGAAGRVLSAVDPEAMAELVDFALSEGFGQLRAELSLSIG